MKYGFGIDLGGTTVKIAYFDETGAMLDKWEIPTRRENSGENIIPDIADAVNRYRKEKEIADGDLLGIGIGVPGAVVNGVVNRCVNLGWGVVPIEEDLSKLTGLPVKASNDANVAALGEYWVGGGKGSQNVIFITLGTGVGGGIILDGKLLNGTHGAGGELGHMVLNPKETAICGCGKRGCVEQYCSATGIVRLAHQRLEKDEMPSSLRALEENVTCRDIFDAGKAGDQVALEILDTYFDYMGQFLGSTCSVIDPEAVVIGGGVSKAGQVLLDGIAPYFHKYVFHAASGVKFALANLGNDAGAYGAFKLVLDR